MEFYPNTVAVTTGSLDGASPLSVARAQRACRNRRKKKLKKSVKKQGALCADLDAPEGIGRIIAEGANAVKRKAILRELLTKCQTPIPVIPSAAGAYEYLIRDCRKPYRS